MKFVDEFRDPATARAVAGEIRRIATRTWTIMEVCGGQTHSIVRYGLDEALAPAVELLHGPGCPVCVTPLEMIDRAHRIAARKEVIFCSYGDMLRVPGSEGDLLSLKAKGADVRAVYSPLDALALARAHPAREVVFFAIGFETTAPANATAIWQAKVEGVKNFSALVSHVLVPPALEAILAEPDNRVQAFLGPGHVCTVMGTAEYGPIVDKHRVPVVVTGFEPLDLLEGVLRAVRQLEAGQARLDNQYSRGVRPEGNAAARARIDEVFEVCERKWRGIGAIPASGWRLREGYRAFDAERKFEVSEVKTSESKVCISGQILRGLKKPVDCPAFGRQCTPSTPLGATMVSSEGACAAYHAHGRRAAREPEPA